MFGRPAYFFGGDNLPGVASSGTTAAAAASSSVALGEDESIVGACWNGETHLLVTSAHSVRVFHIEHLHVPLRTWNFRPDQEHLLTSPAVIVGQKRSSLSSASTTSESSRSIVAIQNSRTAIAWKHSDESLDTLQSVELPNPVFELLGGFFPDIAIAVTKTGDVICLDPDLQNVGTLSFRVDPKFCSPRSLRVSHTPRPRRRSRSNSNIGIADSSSSTSSSSSLLSSSFGGGEEPEWVVHWAKHAPYRSGALGKSVLLFVLLRKPGDPDCNDLLAIHELSRPRGNQSNMSMKTISQHNIGAQVSAASISVTRENSGVYKHKFLIIGREALVDDDDNHGTNRVAFLRVLAFPDGPFGPPSVTSSRGMLASSAAVNDAHSDHRQPRKRRRTGRRGRTSSSSSSSSEKNRAEFVQSESFALAALSSRHAVVARVDPASGGIRCSGWDSGFCVPVANMMVPCRNEGTATGNGGAGFTRGGCSSSGMRLEVCNDGNTVALVGKKTLVVFAIKCAEPTLANVVGCGQELGSDISNNCVQAIVMPNSTSKPFSLVTGAPDASVWNVDTGSGAIAGRLENEALCAALRATTADDFNAIVISHLNSDNPLPLLSQNYIRATVTACHRFGVNSRVALRRLIATGRVSAWACPVLIRVVLKSSSQMIKSQKLRRSAKKRGKRFSSNSVGNDENGLLLVEECLRNVQDLHEDAIVELLQFVIRNVDASDAGALASCVQLLRLIVALPYNGSFLQTFLRRLTTLEIRLMLTFMRKLINEENKRQGKTTGCPTMSQAIGWTTILLDAHFQSIVVSSRSQPKMMQVISALVQDLQDLIETCNCAERIKAQISHLRQSKQLPFEPVPAYSIESLQAFELDL